MVIARDWRFVFLEAAGASLLVCRPEGHPRLADHEWAITGPVAEIDGQIVTTASGTQFVLEREGWPADQALPQEVAQLLLALVLAKAGAVSEARKTHLVDLVNRLLLPEMAVAKEILLEYTGALMSEKQEKPKDEIIRVDPDLLERWRLTGDIGPLIEILPHLIKAAKTQIAENDYTGLHLLESIERNPSHRTLVHLAANAAKIWKNENPIDIAGTLLTLASSVDRSSPALALSIAFLADLYKDGLDGTVHLERQVEMLDNIVFAFGSHFRAFETDKQLAVALVEAYVGKLSNTATEAGKKLENAPPEVIGPTAPILLEAPHQTSDRDAKDLIKRYDVLVHPIALAVAPPPVYVQDKLTAEFPWAEELVQTITDELVLSKRLSSDGFRLPPIIIHGRSGVGKSRFARRLAEICNLSFTMYNSGGSTDNRMLAGTARGWGSAQPCLPLVIMRTFMTANPVIIVEEIDKAGGNSRNGNVMHTLLTMTDRATARKYYDECLLCHADLSRVTWIFTANDVNAINPMLRSRCKILEMPAPRPEDFDTLVECMLEDIAQEYECDPEMLPEIEPEIYLEMRRGYCSGRLQARQLAALVRRVLVVAARLDSEKPRM